MFSSLFGNRRRLARENELLKQDKEELRQDNLRLCSVIDRLEQRATGLRTLVAALREVNKSLDEELEILRRAGS